jgi:hypothetical protein
VTLMPWSSPGDEPSFRGGGKVTHPSGAPNGDCLVTYAAGPANLRTSGIIDGGIYRLPGCGPTTGPNALVPIVNDPAYNEMFPRAVVPYREIYGIDEPKSFPWLPNDGTAHPALPAGTPYGIVGTSSVYNRESAPADGLEAFNGPGVVTATGALANNWVSQGSDAGIFDNSEIDAIRIVTLEPTTESVSPWSAQGERLWLNHAIERTRILGEIPLRKPGVTDAQGNPDTSFSAKIPADVPFTFQLIDRNGLLLTMAQTWHQVRPGEVRTDCGGCHAHSKPPLDFATTAAAKAPPVDLTKAKPRDVEFLRDVRPILQAKCVSCHRGAAPAGNLALDDLTPVKITSFSLPKGTWPADYLRLAYDPDARWGTKPPSGTTWRHLNASRYVRMFQSRRSLLVWKIFGRRMDGQTNDTWKDDLDYTGTIMPPPDSGLTLTDAERRTIATWIDLGAPIDGGGWFDDETRPTLTVSSPRPNENQGPLTEIRIGVADHFSGLDLQSLSVTADVPLAGRRRGEELAKFGSFTGEGVFSINLDPPIARLDRARLTVKIKDRRGNLTEQTVRFWVGTPVTTAAARQ